VPTRAGLPSCAKNLKKLRRLEVDRAEQLEDEIDALTGELSRAVGHMAGEGRPVKASSQLVEKLARMFSLSPTELIQIVSSPVFSRDASSSERSLRMELPASSASLKVRLSQFGPLEVPARNVAEA
jgi:hypothetical protein